MARPWHAPPRVASVVKAMFTISLRQAARTACHSGAMFLHDPEIRHMPFIADRAAALDATRLIDDHGVHASDVAAANASLFRDRGNAVSFCRWRQIERLIAVLMESDGEQTRH